MALYGYTAKNKGGQKIHGKTTGSTRAEVIHALKEKELFPIDIKQLNDVNAKSDRTEKQNKIKKKDIAVFASQFSTMLHAGVPLLVILDVMIKQEKNHTMKDILEKINNDILGGSSLSEAMEKCNIFNQFTLRMVQIGEMNGKLDLSFSEAASVLEREIKTVSKVKGALLYPSVVLFASIIASIILITFVVPVFKSIFEQVGAELPLITTIFMKTADFIKNFWYVLIFLASILVFLAVKLIKNPKSRANLDMHLLKLPFVGSFLRTSIMAKFCRTFSLLIEGGINLLTSLEVTKNALNNNYAKECFLDIINKIHAGSSISLAVSGYDIFSPLVISMIRIGEESGKLGEVLQNTADYYEENMDLLLQRITTMIEPVLTLVMALVVGFIVVAIVSPMFGIYGIIGK